MIGIGFLILALIAIPPSIGATIDRRRKRAGRTAVILRESTFGFPPVASPAVGQLRAVSRDPWSLDSRPLDVALWSMWDGARHVLRGTRYTFADYLAQGEGRDEWLEWRRVDQRLKTRMDTFSRRLDVIGQRLDAAYDGTVRPARAVLDHAAQAIHYHTTSWMTETGQFAVTG